MISRRSIALALTIALSAGPAWSASGNAVKSFDTDSDGTLDLAEVKKAADAGKCFDNAMKEVKLPKYEKWANYETTLPANVERFCYWWARGY